MRKLLVLLLLAPCALLAQVPDYVPTEGLIGWYALDGDAHESSGNQEDGVLVNVSEAHNRFGAAGSALALLGDNAYVDLGLENQAMVSATDTLTLSFWALPDGDYGAPLTKYQNGSAGSSSWFIEYSESNGYRFWGNGASGTPTPQEWPTLCPNSPEGWSHVVVVFQGGTGQFWMNGDSLCSASFPVSSNAGQNLPVLLGRSECSNGTTCNAFTGSLDDLGMWNRALTSEEIAALFAADEAPLPNYLPADGLLAWYPFNGNANDESGNGLDGSVDGAALTEDRTGTASSAYAFDGTDRISTAGSPFNGQTALTFSAWIQSDNPAPYSVLMSEWPAGGATFKLDHSTTDEFLRFDLITSDGFHSASVDFATSQWAEWSHFIAVYDGAAIQLYLDGEAMGTPIPASGSISATAGEMLIGDEANNSAPFQGRFDDIALWGRALTAAEIETLFTGLDLTPHPGCTDPIACNYDPTATEDNGSCLETVSLDLGLDILTCDDAMTLDASGPFNQYNWSNGSEEPITTVYSTGTYAVTAGFGTTNQTSLDFNDELETAFISGTNNNCVQDYLSGSMDLGVAQNAISAVTVEFETSNGSICGGSCASWGIKLELRDDAGQTVDSLVLGGVFDTSCIQTGTTGTFTFTPDFTSDQTAAPVLFLQSVDFAWASARITHIEFGNPTCTVTDSVQVLMTDCATLNALCGEGSIWDNATQQCTDTMDNGSFPCGTGTVWDPVAQECIVAIPTDTDFDGCVSAGDVLNLLATFGTCPPVPEWPDADFDVTCMTWNCGDPMVYQGDTYATVLIGGQCWFAENLRADTFRNGENIPVATPDSPLHTTGMSARVAYAYDNARVDSLGWLYNGFVAIDDRGACPAGWSVPTDEDFKDLERHLGMPEDEVQGTSFRGSDEAFALKSSSVDQPGWNGTNSTGFSAIPCGVHYDSFSGVESSVQFWCRDGLGFNSDNYYRTFTAGGRIYRSTHNISDGHTIRCLKD